MRCIVIITTILMSGLIVLNGCTKHRGWDFTLVSTKSVERLEGGVKVSVEHCAFRPFLELEEAVDKAIEDAGPSYNALTDVAITFHTGLPACYSVQGTAVKAEEWFIQSHDQSNALIPLE